MNRRIFIKAVTTGMIALGIEGESQIMAQEFDKKNRCLAITMDDPNMYQTPLLSPKQRNQAILGYLDAHKIKAGLFVCGERIDNPEGIKLLAEWNDSGHILGNHTYSHPYYHSDQIDSDAYIKDIKKCNDILGKYTQYSRRFRYPFLKAGNTVEKRDSVRKYLKDNDHTHGYVTIDTSDWYIDDRMKEMLKSNPGIDTNPYRKFYIEHMLERAEYYDVLSQQTLGRSMHHTLLMHHNLLNALYLGDLLNAFKDNGWSLIDASRAFDDPVFNREPDIIPAGESITWAIAKESGRFDDILRYPAEDGSYEEVKMDKLGL